MDTLAMYLSRLLDELFDRYWDYRLGIKTVGVHPSAAASQFGDNVTCRPTRYRLLLKVLRSVYIEQMESEIFVDYGCGKGRVICFFAQFPFEKVIGVEVSEVWAEHSMLNTENLRGAKAKEISVVAEDAANFDPKEGTVFYFFNPFGEKTFRAVLDQIRKSLLQRPRSILIIYYNTACKHVIDQEPWLEQKEVIHKYLTGKPAIITYRNISSSQINQSELPRETE